MSQLLQSPKTRIRFVVAYEGTGYCGWQRQNQDGQVSVAHVIEQALSKIFNEKISLFASGRTDAGVHALNQVCHFDTSWRPERAMNWDLGWALKPHLPPEIVVKRAWVAPPEFHATISATHKTYKYYVSNRRKQNPFLIRYSHWIRDNVDIDHLNASSKLILGEHDFKSFQSVGTDMAHTVRTIYEAEWIWKRSDHLEFTITGSGFLKQMVRNLVGTQLLLERKKLPPHKMKEILEALDRQKAAAPAPAQGLFLHRVFYPAELDAQCIPMKNN